MYVLNVRYACMLCIYEFYVRVYVMYVMYARMLRRLCNVRVSVLMIYVCDVGDARMYVSVLCLCVHVTRAMPVMYVVYVCMYVMFVCMYGLVWYGVYVFNVCVFCS